MFEVRAGPADGVYLHAWPYDFGLAGQGFAPLSSPTHHLITRAALDALPEVRVWLGAEAELLTWCYCGLQDMNWETYSRFNDAPECFRGLRFPDSRREWEISRYCRFNPIARQGVYLHQAPDVHYQRAAAAAKRGRSWDAVRLLGIALHSLQDIGSPMHAAGVTAPEIHTYGERPCDHAALEGLRFQPGEGFDPGQAGELLRAFSLLRGQAIARLLEADIAADVLELQMECAVECVKVTVDALADFHRRFAERLHFGARPPRKGVNLLHNPDFAVPDDEEFCPQGWVMKWRDRADCEVRIGRERTRRGWTVTARNVGARVACLTTWPRAVRVRPGQLYYLEGSAVASAPETCGLCAELYDATTRSVAELSCLAATARRWRRLRLEVPVGEGGAILRTGAFAERTPGPARFTDLRLIRVG